MPDARCQMPDARCQMPGARCQEPDVSCSRLWVPKTCAISSLSQRVRLRPYTRLMNDARLGFTAPGISGSRGRYSRRESARLRRPAAVGDVRGARPRRAASFSWNEIARSLPGDDQRLAARQLQLGSQPADVRADVFRLRLVPVAPDLA